jgi:uncharacterized ferritin-like protein (DUF455 family)
MNRSSTDSPTLPDSLATGASAILSTAAPDEKIARSRVLAAAWRDGSIGEIGGPAAPDEPARPAHPRLLPPREMPKRRAGGSQAGRIALLHALAHIELNAINLALDAVWRFAGQPEAYYADWLRVAAEEAHHFGLLQARLQDFGHTYGDFPAHDGLWDMCARTRDDVLARMALVPRTLEARGLDASPPIRARLAQAGDEASAAILDVILRDEIGHVRIGNHWFRHLCEQRGLEPHETYARLAEQYRAPRLRGPFNFDARRDAGFDEAELAALAAQFAGVASGETK